MVRQAIILRALIREDLKRKTEEDLERKLLEAIESSEYKEVTPVLFEKLRARVTKKPSENTEDAL